MQPQKKNGNARDDGQQDACKPDDDAYEARNQLACAFDSVHHSLLYETDLNGVAVQHKSEKAANTGDLLFVVRLLPNPKTGG